MVCIWWNKRIIFADVQQRGTLVRTLSNLQAKIILSYLCSVIHVSIYGPKFGLLISFLQIECCIHYCNVSLGC
jgi:hypothetical protein